MPITLAQAQVNTATDVDYAVIDNLRRYSWLLDQVAFDDTATPGTGGGSLVYGYTRLTTAAPASFRALNTEYAPGQATRTPFDRRPEAPGRRVHRRPGAGALGQAADERDRPSRCSSC
jgi:hypothetical protein